MNYVKKILRILAGLAAVVSLMLDLFPGVTVPPLLAGGIMIGLAVAIIILMVIAFYEKINRVNGPHDQTHGS